VERQQAGFNPGLGFLPASTNQPPPSSPGPVEFQSRSGFSPCLDLLASTSPCHVAAGFQSRSGFSPCLDPRRTGSTCALWPGFNPGLGFLPASTLAVGRHRQAWDGFNPGLGFLPASTRSPSCVGWTVEPCFNPGLGFLPASTRPRSTRGCNVSRVSIPVWVFSLPRPTSRAPARFARSRFQSRSGFSPCLDPMSGQSSAGTERVSIPVWVFSLPRHHRARTSGTRCPVSIPVWVFSLPRPPSLIV